MLSILWSFRTPMAIIIGILGILFAIWGYGHHQKNLGRAEVQVKLDAVQLQFRQESTKWYQQVEAQEREIYMARKQKEEANKKNLEDLFKKQKENDKKRSDRENEIKANIKPTDTITVPSVFERVYNAVAKGSTIGGEQEGVRVSEDRSSLVGQTRTFDATAFSQVIIGNAEKYNRLAIQCSKLIDTINDLEATYNVNNEGLKGTVGKDGRNVSTGTSGPEIRGPS